MINRNSRIFITGHKGLVGSAIYRKLKAKGYTNLLIADRKKLDLTNQIKVIKFLKKKKPDFIFIAAAKVGGIYYNLKYKADFITENLQIQTNLIHGAYKCGIKDLIFLGSSCVYPKNCKQPIKETYLLSGKLEETNDAYAIAKIAGIKMCQSYNEQYKTKYKCLMPTNTYGPNDNYDKNNSHFIPALIKKIHKLKLSKKNTVILWGNGKAKREVIHVDDIAEACIFFMKKKTEHFLINIGTGKDYSIKYYLEFIAKVILGNKKIKIKYDKTKPNGSPRKVMDISLAKKYGWKSKMSLITSIRNTYKSFVRENF
ncbi:GDP-L-fucose synthase family protein [Candidatus Pelagibacter communis]|uniref:GDP-L-fucose synthase n=1 Tax=Pelagibacter ubique (strain HTCC1062) TaxID=335992 RepID=Q4FN47_PELUB|nr:GDP-L-fucose synthase [Candidatus Pelagibacter ubique]AAZ21392.1 GDP-fucose synthetase chain A [Candidatus Pelagibacter ubique HTCC1062]